jgi:hypothetical protein
MSCVAVRKHNLFVVDDDDAMFCSCGIDLLVALFGAYVISTRPIHIIYYFITNDILDSSSSSGGGGGGILIMIILIIGTLLFSASLISIRWCDIRSPLHTTNNNNNNNTHIQNRLSEWLWYGDIQWNTFSRQKKDLSHNCRQQLVGGPVRKQQERRNTIQIKGRRQLQTVFN